jgi:hypothetical protein
MGFAQKMHNQIPLMRFLTQSTQPKCRETDSHFPGKVGLMLARRHHNGSRHFRQTTTKSVWAGPGRFWVFPALTPGEWQWLRWCGQF